MKIYIFLLCLIGLSLTNIYAQTPDPAAAAAAAAAAEREQQRQAAIEARQAAQEQQRLNEQQRMRALLDRQNSSIEDSSVVSVNSQAIQDINALYRKTSKNELKSIAPEKQDFVRFRDFLRVENTGLVKLAMNKGCADNPNVIVVTADCLKHTMPGNGSSYSFRAKDYRIPRLADITLFKDTFQATGIRLHGVFVALGDVPLEQVTLQTKGAGFLVSFTPESDFQKAKELDEKLRKGIESDGFSYQRIIAVKENTTYLLRSVAYRGTLWRAVSGLTYNELDFDQRNDIVVAFRVVRRYDDGSVLILWKRLSKKDSPKIKTKEDKDNQNKRMDFTTAAK